jgi:hypothetical protein
MTGLERLKLPRMWRMLADGRGNYDKGFMKEVWRLLKSSKHLLIKGKGVVISIIRRQSATSAINPLVLSQRRC